MFVFAPNVILACGAKSVDGTDISNDPTTEEEFKLLKYNSDTPITWQQYQNTLPIIQKKYGLNNVKSYRDKLLKDSDWIMTTDNTATIANIEEWNIYRQTLRDAPEKFTNYIWKPNSLQLDFEAMGFPKTPKVIRK